MNRATDQLPGARLWPGFVVVEGPIGVGKTTLAKRLARSYGSNMLLEAAEENPFLEKFYENPRSAALPTQLHFLMQRTRQLKMLKQDDMFNPVRVADFLIHGGALTIEGGSVHFRVNVMQCKDCGHMFRIKFDQETALQAHSFLTPGSVDRLLGDKEEV